MTLAIGAYFWIDSRYPALLKKLHRGKAVKITGAISFDAILPVTASMPLFTRVWHTAANWLWTNRIGMTFGICFGAAALTFLATLPRRRFRSSIANTLAGAVTGVPLGVCANCVAPIGQGLFTAGASANTVLATMISSPTLNVVVLAMAFSLFPIKIALLRLVVPLVLIALVPLIARSTAPAEPELCALPSRDGWLQPTTGTLTSYLRNLARLAATTIPLMILAALLGALVAELLSAQNLPTQVSLLGIISIALIGTFLPVPMAFDVAAAFVLMSRGLPLPYVVTLLCTLGAFGIYSFLILGRTVSWRTAALLFGAVTLLGATAGIGTALAQGGL
jgi:uncharacterized membrane protein YraQ (UPF0718 family)